MAIYLKRLIISPEVAKAIVEYGSENGLCFYQGGKNFFAQFAVRYRMTSVNWVLYNDARGIRALRNLVTEMLSQCEEDLYPKLSMLEVILTTQLQPKAV